MNVRHLGLALTLLAPAACRAQDAHTFIANAVRTELAADRSDHTAFQYYDRDITPDHDTTFYTVETPQGILRRQTQDHGHPLTPQQRQADDARIHAFLSDPAAQQKALHDSGHDDNQAEQMLELLPQAFLWSITAEDGPLVTLAFKPDPAYSPDSMEARVLSAMAGQVVINRNESRIHSIRGTLVADVKFGFGLFGRIRQGGTFQVERREVVPGHWQMTESHVHISGKALFFKTIGSQEDETRWDFHISPAQTLQQAVELLNRQHLP